MIEIRQISKAFGEQQVLSAVTLTIESGKTTAILGPSGTGKSVLLKIITGLLDSDSGEVLIDGVSMTKALMRKRQELRQQMGVLFQGAALLDSLTLFDNVAFPLIERGERDRKTVIREVHRRLDEVGLAEYSTAVPGEISIGMRKRVGIARALITNPSIILFDEPNTGLDPESGQEIYELIQQTQRSSGFTGIVISHEIPEVFQVCDRVAMLFKGIVQAEGPVENFRSESHPSFKNPIVRQFFRGEISGPISIG